MQTSKHPPPHTHTYTHTHTHTHTYPHTRTHTHVKYDQISPFVFSLLPTNTEEITRICTFSIDTVTHTTQLPKR